MLMTIMPFALAHKVFDKLSTPWGCDKRGLVGRHNVGKISGLYTNQTVWTAARGGYCSTPSVFLGSGIGMSRGSGTTRR
jgi:hypothetical protein